MFKYYVFENTAFVSRIVLCLKEFALFLRRWLLLTVDSYVVRQEFLARLHTSVNAESSISENDRKYFCERKRKYMNVQEINQINSGNKSNANSVYLRQQ